MQKAFWDGIMESLKQEPNYDRVIQLVREVQDELCNMAPESWKQQITEAFDIDFLSQVLINHTRAAENRCLCNRFSMYIYVSLFIFCHYKILKSGNLDLDYLGRILEFTLVTLQKLSSPSKESKLKASYESLFGELSEICRTEDKSNNPCVIALIKGLQFVLEQTQV